MTRSRSNRATSPRRRAQAALLALTLVLAVACGDEGEDAEPGGQTEPPAETLMDIRGQVTGLDGGTVAVSNRGGDAAVIAANGAFTLVDQDEGSYDVEVVTNPLDQQCTVTGGNGFEEENDVDGVQIVCAAVDAAGCVGAVDSDGDTLTDCAELDTWGTNPWIADTDGDGFDDGREVQDFNPGSDNFLFNPRIADLASVAIDVESLPEVTLDFKLANDQTESVAVERSSQTTTSIQRDRGGSQTRQLETGHTVSASTQQTIGTEVSVSPAGLGGSASYELSLTAGFEASTTQSRGSSINWSESEAEENAEAHAESVSQSQTSGTTYEGGQLSVLVSIRNDGNLAYDLENLKLSAYLFDPARPFAKRAIGTLELGSRDFPTTSIGVNSTSAPLVFTTDLLLPTAQSLLRDARNLVIEPATYRLLDISNGSILLRDQDVAARTATVTIDYGELAGRIDSHRIAVNRGGAVKFITAADALDEVMGLDFEEGAGDWIYGDAASATSSFSGLTRVRGYAMDADTSQYWLVAHSHKTEGGAGAPITDFHNLLLAGYELDQIVLQAGDHLALVYVGDADRDALSDRLEDELGTDAADADTDDDTIDDGVELYGWYTNLASPPCDEGDLTLVKSNPLLADTDDDAIDDGVERAGCGNPGFDFAAVAGDDRWVNLESVVQLSGGYSGTGVDAPEYRWTLIQGPDVEGPSGATRELFGATPSFTAPDEVSSLLFELEVTSDGVSQTDQVVVQVLEDTARAVFVGELDPGDVPDGSPERPYSTLDEALLVVLFEDDGHDIYVMTRETSYIANGSIVPPAGTSLYGGYDEHWIRDVNANRTPVQLATSSGLEVQPVLLLDDVEGEVTISGFAWTTQRGHNRADRDVYGVVIRDATLASQGSVRLLDNTIVADDVYGVQTNDPADSYGLWVDGLDRLELSRNTITSGRGGWGGKGTKGATGVEGDHGGNGGIGNAGGSSGRGDEGENGGKGGDGGTGFNEAGSNGGYGDAHNGACGMRGTGGSGSTAPTSGRNGCTGRSGARGVGGRGIGSADRSNGYTPTQGATGGKGGPGGGGGGGGGGRASNTGWDGGAGGGGGEGGGGGHGGTGGIGGGASIAVWLANVEVTFIRDSDIVAGPGGLGGNGGEAGDGGPYGDGGSGSVGDDGGALGRGGQGANGGNGGPGGDGGWGGGGGGGASIGVFFASGRAPLIIGNRVTTAGGGSGGYSPATTGAGYGGDSYGVFDALADDQFPSVSGNTFSIGAGGPAGYGTDNTGRSGEQN